MYITLRIKRSKGGRDLSLFFCTNVMSFIKTSSAVILDERKISNNVLKQCFGKLLVVNPPDSSGFGKEEINSFM